MYQTTNPPDIVLPTCSISQSKHFTCILLITVQHTALISVSMGAPVCPVGSGMTAGVVQPENNLAQVCVVEKADGGKGSTCTHRWDASLPSCAPVGHILQHQSRRAPTYNSSASVTFQLSLFLLVRWSVLLNTAVPAQTKLVLLECYRTQKTYM